MTANQTAEQVYQILPVKDLSPDPNQPRTDFDADSLQTLADSIKAQGIIQPIIIRRVEGKAIIIDGERRYRASKLAKLKQVPVIERSSQPDDEDDAAILIKQVAANQHVQLKPLEMAAFFEQLVTRCGQKVGQIPDLLKQHGIKQYSREAVSNLRNLVNLPGWAKDKINDGILTPSHGKIILQAKDHPAVLAEVQTDIDMEIEQYGLVPNVDEVAAIVRSSYEAHYRNLYNCGHNKPAFDISSCDKCKTCKRYTKPFKQAFCLDETCWDEKQAEALAARQQAEKKQAAAATASANTGSADDNETGAAPELSSTARARQAGRVEATQLHLDDWLIAQLNTHLASDDATKYSLLLWLAAGAPGNTDWPYYNQIDTPRSNLEDNHTGINEILAQQVKPVELLDDIVTRAVGSINRKNLRALARHCDISLDGGINNERYHINTEYLGNKTKAELIEFATPRMTDIRDDWAKDCKQPVSEIIDLILRHPERFGVPDDLQSYYSSEASDD